jgi:hypothetical protein
MRTATRGRAGAILAAALCASMHVCAAPTIADFAADTDFSFPTLSPSGNQIAFVTRVQDTRVLVVLDIAQRQRKVIMRATTRISS